MAPASNIEFVIGIGASAGGITAMRTALPRLPAEQRLAYVLCQHLDPKHVSTLDEILERTGSALRIAVAQHDQRLEGNHLYIVPPHVECTVDDGVFHVQDRTSTGVRHGIDTLLTSIAQTYGDRAIGIILSGTGHDGLQGIRAIKSAGGLAMVQAPDDAEYPSMPEAVVRERLADVIAPLDHLGQELQRLLQWPGKAAEAGIGIGGDDFAALIRVLIRKTGLAFDQYKETTLRRRIERRMMVTGENDLHGYRSLVERSDEEVAHLHRDLLISVTSFFRDAKTFQAVRDALESIVGRKPLGQPIRIWVAGCATGEEAYSIAMLLAELKGGELDAREVQIFATDVDESAITAARQGIYVKATIRGVPEALVKRYFQPVDGSYRVSKQIRDVITFAGQDLLRDPPFSRLDLVSCRNVLIYFKPETQDRLLRTFQYALIPGGFLVLGPSENITRAADLFEPVSSMARVFVRTDAESPLPPATDQTRPSRKRSVVSAAGIAGMEQQIRDLIYQKYAPPTMLLDADFNTLFVHGDVSRFARLPQGGVTTNVLDMVDPPLRLEMRLVTQKSEREQTIVRSRTVTYSNNSGAHEVTLVAMPAARDPERGARTLLMFEDRPPNVRRKSDRIEASEDAAFRIQELEQELTATRDHLQTSIEELEASNEELQSINEEYQSTTEELQSANEELQTTNEELQSTNEELSTVNEELHVRTDEVSAANKDLEGILNTAVTGIVVLDGDLRVTRYSAASRQIFDLLPTSIGRPLITVGGSVDLALLSAQIRQSIDQGEPVEHRLELADKVFLVHLIPREASEGGLIISFIDVTNELTAARQAQLLAAVLQDSSEAITVYGADGRIHAWNRGAQRLFGFTESEAQAMTVYDLSPEEERDNIRDLTDRVMAGQKAVQLDTVRCRRDGQTVAVGVTATALLDHDGKPYAVATTERDVTLERATEARRRQLMLAHEERLMTAGEMTAGLAHELNQPLSAIVQYCDLATSIARNTRIRRRGELTEALEDIAQQAHRAGDIIANLRRFVGRSEASREPNDINDVIREAVDFMAWDLQHAGITVRRELAEHLPRVTIDRTQIEQVLVNLVRNATDAMTEAGSDPRIVSISTAADARHGESVVRVTVTDTGPGVPKTIADRLFSPFQSTKPNGLGMGLWISRSIIESHGGRLSADLDEAGGSFHFTLPLGDANGP